MKSHVGNAVKSALHWEIWVAVHSRPRLSLQVVMSALVLVLLFPARHWQIILPLHSLVDHHFLQLFLTLLARLRSASLSRAVVSLTTTDSPHQYQ